MATQQTNPDHKPTHTTPHCLVVPLPATGHINPMLQFSKRLLSKNIRVTLVLTRYVSQSITATTTLGTSLLRLDSISDGYDHGGMDAAESTRVYLDTFREVGSESLAELIRKQSEAGEAPVHCVVYDHCVPWCLDVAKKFGVRGAAFLTQSCAVDCIYNHVYRGLIVPPVTEQGRLGDLPGLPPLEVCDLPSMVSEFGSYPAIFDTLVEQFRNIGEADWVFCNSVYELENEAAEWLSTRLPKFKTIGPTIPSMYLDERLEDDVDYGFSIFKPINDLCMDWLHNKPKRSVAYVSFGSMASLGAEQMEELFCGLNNSKHYFLWVVRETEEAKLPITDHFAAPDRGLIVPWCSQLEVLASEAVGCFVTHCGWNSTLEGVSLGVPMVAMPQWTDQPTNAKFIRDVWGMGVRVEESGVVVGREEIERCVREVMEGGRGEEIRRNGERFRELMKDAVGEGGSSDRNIGMFATSLIDQVSKVSESA